MLTQVLNIKELSDILEESNITDTTRHDGLLSHTITHPVFGEAITVQGSDGALLITHS